MTEFQAAVLSAQMTRLEAQLARRQSSARILDRLLEDVPGIRLLHSDPRMDRRSYHMYIFRVDQDALGISRDRFVEALAAEGVPCSKGWYRPLYLNGLFQNTGRLPVHGIRSPLAGTGADYSRVHCPVCEQVCGDTVWIPQHVLLASEKQILETAEAVRKVIAHHEQLR